MTDDTDDMKADLTEVMDALTEDYQDGCFILIAVLPTEDDGSRVTAVTNLAVPDVQDVLHSLLLEEPEGAPFAASVH